MPDKKILDAPLIGALADDTALEVTDNGLGTYHTTWLQIRNALNVNTALSNVGYLDKVNTFVMAQSVKALTITDLNTAGGIVQTDGGGVTSTSVTLPNGTLATTQSSGDNSTKLATTAYVDTHPSIGVWTRTISGAGSPYLVPTNAGDNIDLNNGGLIDTSISLTTPIAIGNVSNLIFDTVDQTIIGSSNEINNKFSDMGSPNGIKDRTEFALNWTDSTPDRTLTLVPVSSSFDIYEKGVKKAIIGSDSVQITDVEGLHIIYYDSGVLTSLVTPTSEQIEDIFLNKVAVSIVRWDATNKKGKPLIETHGITMDGQTHVRLHQNPGTVYLSGLALGDFVVDGNGDLNTHAQFSCASGEIKDEDILLDMLSIASTVGIEVWYLDGSDWRWVTNTGFSVLTTGTGRLAWNNAGTQQEVGNNNFVNCHVFAINTTDKKCIVLQGQSEYATIGDARIGAEIEISNLILSGLSSPEVKPIGTVIFQTSNSYSNAVKARVRSTDTGDNYVDFRFDPLSAAQPASNHGSLSGLPNDDHMQYALLLGRLGGQTLIGGTVASENLVLQSTSNATRGLVLANDIIQYDATKTFTHDLDLVNKKWVEDHGTGTDEFAELLDVTAPYNNIGALTVVNGTTDGMTELTTLVTEPATNQFQIARGTTVLLATSSCTIDQNLQTTANTEWVNVQVAKIGVGVAPTTHAVEILMASDENITIDGRTNLRSITLGAQRQLHSPSIPGTRAFHFDMRSNGQDDTKGVVIRHDSEGGSANINPQCLNLQADIVGATNYHVDYLKISKTGDIGSNVTLHGIDIREGISPIHQHAGAVVDIEQAFTYDGSYTDVTTAFASPGTNVQIFVNNGDYIYIGSDIPFSDLEVILQIVATGAGVKPAVEYSLGSSSWGALSFVDTTNGFRQNGSFLTEIQGDWATESVDGVTKLWWRIERTQNTLGTVPTESTIRVTNPVTYEWDKDGHLQIDSIDLSVGTSINEFSIDGTLVGNSDDAVPTEKAIKTYIDGHAGLSKWSQDATYVTPIDTRSVNIANGESYFIDGDDINTANTLSNLAYKNSINVYTQPQLISVATDNDPAFLTLRNTFDLTEWRVAVNNSGSRDFVIQDITYSFDPIVISENSNDNVIVIQSSGNLNISNNALFVNYASGDVSIGTSTVVAGDKFRIFCTNEYFRFTDDGGDNKSFVLGIESDRLPNSTPAVVMRATNDEVTPSETIPGFLFIDSAGNKLVAWDSNGHFYQLQPGAMSTLNGYLDGSTPKVWTAGYAYMHTHDNSANEYNSYISLSNTADTALEQYRSIDTNTGGDYVRSTYYGTLGCELTTTIAADTAWNTNIDKFIGDVMAYERTNNGQSWYTVKSDVWGAALKTNDSPLFFTTVGNKDNVGTINIYWESSTLQVKNKLAIPASVTLRCNVATYDL